MRWDRQTMSAANIGPTRCHSVSSTFHSASGAPRPGTLRVTCPHAQTSSPYRCFSCVTCSPNSPSAPTSTSSTYTPVRATKPAPVNASPHTSHWVGAWTCSPVRGNSTRRLCPGAPFWRPAGRFLAGSLASLPTNGRLPLPRRPARPAHWARPPLRRTRPARPRGTRLRSRPKVGHYSAGANCCGESDSAGLRRPAVR